MNGELEAMRAEDEPVWSDPRITAARELLADQHQPLTMTPGDLRRLLIRYRLRLLEVFGQSVGDPERETPVVNCRH